MRSTLSEIANNQSPITAQRQAIQNALKKLFENTIQDNLVIQQVTQQINSWIASRIDEAQPTAVQSLIQLLEQVLTTIFASALTKTVTEESTHTFQQVPSLDHPPLAVIRDFLTQGTLPQGYKSNADFIETLMVAAQQSPLRTQLIPLLKTTSLPPQHIAPLLAILTPLPLPLLSAYQTTLLKADILRADTVADKQKVLYQLLLHTLDQTTDASTFIQLILLKISQQSQLSPKELLRRVILSAQQNALTTQLPALLQKLAPSLAGAAPANDLEIALAPTYATIQQLTGSATLSSQYHTKLLPALQQLLQQPALPTPHLAERVATLIADTFPQLKDQDTIIQAIQQAAERVANTQQRALQKAWQQFTETGQVAPPYTTPQNLLVIWISATPQAPQQLPPLLQAPHIRKRLIAHLSPQSLSKISAQLANPSHQKLIENIYTLWPHTNLAASNSQIAEHAWWDTVLNSLGSQSTSSLPTNAWLAQRFMAVAQTLGTTYETVLLALTTAAKTAPLSLQQTKPLVKLLDSLQKARHKEVRKQAKKSWPKQSILRELHQLLTVGLPALGLHKATALTRLETQLTKALTTQPEAVKQVLITQNNPTQAAKRLAYYLSQPLVQQLIQHLGKPLAPFIQQYMALRQSRPAAKQDDSTLDVFTWQKHKEIAVLTYLLTQGSRPLEGQALLQHSLRQLAKDTNTPIVALQQQLVAQSPLDQDPHQPLQPTNPTPQKEEPIYPTTADPSEADEATLDTPPEEININIENGGIVLLWPFFKELFQAQQLLINDRFVDEIAQSNAVHALQYLATEQLRTKEWHLPLNKLLCGIAYDDIIARGYQFVTPTAPHSTTNTLQGHDTDQQKAQVPPAPPHSPAQHNKQSPEATHQAPTPAPKQSQSALGQHKQKCLHI
ncbi:MAG: contractile injection system tape measure protein [Bacteroidota bacterium]